MGRGGVRGRGGYRGGVRKGDEGEIQEWGN